MKGIILINAFYRSQAVEEQTSRLVQSFRALGVECEVMQNDFVPAYCDNEALRLRLPPCDFVVYLDKDKHIARMLTRLGIRLFNSAEAVEVCDDKLLTHIALSGVVPMPKTVSAPLCYMRGDESRFLQEVEKTLGYPMVVKEAFGSLGRQVHLVRDKAQLLDIYGRLYPYPHLYQQFVQESAGKDLRVIVVGGRAVACMQRQSGGDDFRSNVGLGGKGEITDFPEGAREMAERAARALKLDYCGIDLLYGAQGMLLCEVNSNAFFAEIERVTGVDVAMAYANYIVCVMEGRICPYND